MAENPTITPTDDGPYRVDGLERLRSSSGEELPVGPTVWLCRCGGSQNKPFCDGTHAKIGFKDRRETRSQVERRKAYAGRQITINDNRAICAHAGICTDTLRGVFASGRKPWIMPDEASVEAIVATVLRCPSGALSYTVDGIELGDQERPPTITVSRDGPYFITGGIALEHPRGLRGPSPEHYTLCRCGGSGNKPFCDGTHWSIEFKDPSN
jgi:CDGSH-type Zn-finger protein